MSRFRGVSSAGLATVTSLRVLQGSVCRAFECSQDSR
jgi:hypothetical protein